LTAIKPIKLVTLATDQFLSEMWNLSFYF